MLACKSYSATWEYWGLLQGKEHVKSSLINQCLGTDGMAIWALITVSWDRSSQTLMRFNKTNDYTSITIRETFKMRWIIMATSHKTWEHKTQQVLQKPRKKRFLNSPGLEQSLSPARLGKLTVRAVLSLWQPRAGVTAIPTTWNCQITQACIYWLRTEKSSISYDRSCLWEMVLSEHQISQLWERLEVGRGRWWAGHRNLKCSALFSYDHGIMGSLSISFKTCSPKCSVPLWSCLHCHTAWRVLVWQAQPSQTPFQYQEASQGHKDGTSSGKSFQKHRKARAWELELSP